MNLSFLYGFATLFLGCLLGYYAVQPAAVVVAVVAALHAIPLLITERAAKDLTAVAAIGAAHALVFAGLAYAIGRGVALTLSA
jgi:hypothetical protein